MDYWEECISEAFDEEGIVASQAQIESVAGAVCGCHENYGLAHGHEAIPNPLREELDSVKRDLKAEKDKQICRRCNGTGEERINGPVRSSVSTCFYCRGEGRL